MPIGTDLLKKMQPEQAPTQEAAQTKPQKKGKSVQDVVRKIRKSGCAAGAVT